MSTGAGCAIHRSPKRLMKRHDSGQMRRRLTRVRGVSNKLFHSRDLTRFVLIWLNRRRRLDRLLFS